MCTIVILRRSESAWPLIVGANRDEMRDRPWRAPGRHWPDRGNVVAGLDELAGGSWLGMNDEGVLAAVLNRVGSLGPLPGKRSRGELVLEALDHADAVAAAAALAELRSESYRPFNMVIADNRDAFWLHGRGAGRVAMEELPQGVSMITAHDRDDPADPRVRTWAPRFRAAAPPDPDVGEWAAWEALLAGRGGDGEAAMCFRRPDGFGTVSSALVALPAIGRTGVTPVFRFAAGPPCDNAFENLTA